MTDDTFGRAHGYWSESVTLGDGRVLAHDQENVDSERVDAQGVRWFVPQGRERWTLDGEEITREQYERLLDYFANLGKPDFN